MLNLLNLKIIKFDILLIKNLENLKTCTLRILVVPRTCLNPAQLGSPEACSCVNLNIDMVWLHTNINGLGWN